MIEEPKTIIDVTVADGKYRVILKEGGRLHTLRHGEPWRDCCGDKMIFCLVSELQDARQRIKELEWELDLAKTGIFRGITGEPQ